MRGTPLSAAVLLLLAVSAPAWAPREPLPAPGAELVPDGPRFVLDPGHGGEDLGGVVRGRREKDIALGVALKLKASLERRGGAVALTRDSDRDVPLDERLRLRAGWEGATFVSLHADKVPQKWVRGMKVYAYGRDGGRTPRARGLGVEPLPPPPSGLAEESRGLANSVVRSLRARGLRVAPPARARFYVLKHPTAPSLLVELGYLTNPEEAARLADPEHQGRLAEALAASLIDHAPGGGSAR